MALVKKYDRCNTEIQDNDNQSNITLGRIGNNIFSQKEEINGDLCEVCTNDIVDFYYDEFLQFFSIPPEEQTA